MRLGDDGQGVIGPRRTRPTGGCGPGPSVRSVSLAERALSGCPVSAYASVAVLAPDAIGLLDHVETAAP
jgi:encapsulin shell SprI-like protein